MGAKKNVTVTGTDDVKIVEAPSFAEASEGQSQIKAKKEIKKSRARSGKYQAARALVDKTKKYGIKEAVELVKKMSYSNFDAALEAHLVVRETGTSVEFAFPHSTGKSVKVAIVSDKVIKDIEAGKIDFDVLVATPADMGKITKFARVLGPKGLMPNPKSGTLTPNPEQKKKELEAGSINLKTEKKAPLMHLSVGKVSMKTEELVANIEALLKALKGKALKLSLAATMSPSVRVELD